MLSNFGNRHKGLAARPWELGALWRGEACSGTLELLLRICWEQRDND